MAKRSEPGSGSWLIAEELYESGAPAFVDELRRLATPDRLATFASRWYADTRPASRRLLLEYLDRPLNAFRHEPLVKRLFKLAEAAGDDQIMARFLVAFDRSLRRVRSTQQRYDRDTREFYAEEFIANPRHSTLPRDENAFRYRDAETGERLAASSAAKHALLKLFSLPTRQYLRRRAWRYFRVVGKQSPDRYRDAIIEALVRYTDGDMPDGLSLIDNWGLIHVLFHHSPVLVSTANGWRLAEGKTLADLKPAPAFPSAWQNDAAPLIKLLKQARSRTVRQWSLQMVRQHFPDALSRLPLRDLLEFLAHEDAELVELAAEALRQSPELGSLQVTDWLRLLDDANAQALDVICELMLQRLDAGTVSLDQRVKLSASRPAPIARLGFNWLQARPPVTEAEHQAVLQLVEAEALAIRPEIMQWLQKVLGQSVYFRSEWILELLDSRHADVRDVGWEWFLAEPRASQDVSVWQKLLESPYDDLRLGVVSILETKAVPDNSLSWDRSRLDAAMVRWLWATVLLNIHRGSRTKPKVVSQIVARLERRPDEANELLPILAAALRSVRGPEWRTGLAAIVQLLEQRPELQKVLEREFPELQFATF